MCYDEVPFLSLTGLQIIASEYCPGGRTTFSAANPADGAVLEPVFFEATASDIDSAVRQASAAFESYRELSLEQRAAFLECVAQELHNIDKEIISRAHLETALPHQRLEGELNRTISQLKLIAEQVRQGAYLGERIDAAIPERLPQPKPDIRKMNIPLGPVAIFGASNFPLAFSVAGGDTASALAAGCPVVVKGHPAHPGTSELAGRAIMQAVKTSAAPPGVFSLLQAQNHGAGAALVQHPGIKAVAFTGSHAAGRALFDLACARAEPVPVFAEMGSVNPVFILPTTLADKCKAIAEGLVGSMTLGLGQFCTAPGLVFIEQGEAAELFIEDLASRLNSVPHGTMLHKAVKQNFLAGLCRLEATGVVEICNPQPMPGGCEVVARLYRTDAKMFIHNPVLAEEIFGPVAMVVVCDSGEEVLAAADNLPGQLTATVHGTNDELLEYRDLLKRLECKAGRIVINGFPTGVEVCSSMHHGGPYPATTDSKNTSVGTDAVTRFLRPVCYQDFPQGLLPESLRDK